MSHDKALYKSTDTLTLRLDPQPLKASLAVPLFLCDDDDDDDDDGDRFVKRITQNASTALRVPVRCEEISLQR